MSGTHSIVVGIVEFVVAFAVVVIGTGVSIVSIVSSNSGCSSVEGVMVFPCTLELGVFMLISSKQVCRQQMIGIRALGVIVSST